MTLKLWRAPIQLMLALALVCSAVSADEPGHQSEEPSLPKFKNTNPGEDYYPSPAKRLGVEGRVLLAFKISSAGRAVEISRLVSDNRALESAARALLRDFQFEPPDTSAPEARPYRLGFVFCFPPSGQLASFDPPAKTIFITTRRIPGAPIKNPVKPGDTGLCTGAK